MSAPSPLAPDTDTDAATALRKPRSAYHHGDLRSALLAAARRELDAGAYETLSLRELARLAGVSPNAPYRHFASKDEILAEIAAQGFEEMSARFDAETCPDPRERLVRLCDLYTDFARAHPNVYRVMFGAEKPALMEFDVLREAARASFGRLVSAVAAASGPDGTDEKLVLGRASQLWSLIHGWARLVIDGVACVLPEDCILPASAGARTLVTSW